MPPSFYVMIGAPGSGKSTLVRNMRQAIPNTFVVCPDLIRDLYRDWDNRRVFEYAFQRCRQAISRGQSVIFDATNAKGHERRHLVDFARRLTDTVIGVWLDESLTTCLERCQQRVPLASQATLTENAIRRMHGQLQTDPPTMDEGFLYLINYDPAIGLNQIPVE